MDDADSDDEEDIGNILNDSNSEFAEKTAIENLECNFSKAVIHEKDDNNASNFYSNSKISEAVLRIANPNSESVDDCDDVPLSSLVANKDVVWKLSKRFEKASVEVY